MYSVEDARGYTLSDKTEEPLPKERCRWRLFFLWRKLMVKRLYCLIWPVILLIVKKGIKSNSSSHSPAFPKVRLLSCSLESAFLLATASGELWNWKGWERFFLGRLRCCWTPKSQKSRGPRERLACLGLGLSQEKLDHHKPQKPSDAFKPWPAGDLGPHSRKDS